MLAATGCLSQWNKDFMMKFYLTLESFVKQFNRSINFDFGTDRNVCFD